MVNQLDALEGPSRAAVVARILALQERALKLTPSVFAAKCDLSRSAISNYRTGTRRPSIEQVWKIAGATGVSVDWILYGDRKRELPSYIYKAIYEPER